MDSYAARDLMPGMRVAWCDTLRTVEAVDNRPTWTRVTLEPRRPREGVSDRSYVSQPGFTWDVAPVDQ